MKTARMCAIAIVVMLGVFGGSGSHQAAAQTDTPAPKKKAAPLELKAVGAAAVIDLSKTPAGALFEAKLLAGDKFSWVERAHVTKVLAELELQALFSPDGSSKRVGLGKLLKADLFILLRAGENSDDKKIKFLEIVVCESKYGLRLATDAVPLTGTADAQIAALDAVFDGAVAKLTEKITDVCAVPPFLSLDLDFKHDHLKSACARLLEKHLLKRKGVLLIELAEAQSLAKEATLAGDGGKVERWLPLYFLGAFRNEGTGAEHLVEFDLKLQRGDQTVGNKQKMRVTPLDAPRQLGKWADELADKTLNAPAGGELDAKAEIKQLLSRATAYEQLGNWKESLAMLETALLLDSELTAVNLRASHAAAIVVQRNIAKSYDIPKEAIAALQNYRRALEHFELSARAIVKKDPPVAPNMGKFAIPAPSMDFSLTVLSIQQIKNRKRIVEDRFILWNEVMQEEHETFLRLARLRARAGLGDEHRFLAWSTKNLSAEKRISVTRAMILELKDLPNAKERTIEFVLRGYNGIIHSHDVALAEELAKSPHAEIKAAGESLMKDHANYLAKLKEKPAPPATKLPNAEVRITAIDLVYRKTNAKVGGLTQATRWLAAGPELDFMICRQEVLMMKEKGIVDIVWASPDANAFPQRFCYDGRYLWFSVSRVGKIPRLLVADPKSMETWEFTAADGLPLVDPESLPDRSHRQEIDMAPLGPGRVCLTGSFGRTWLAIATFDPKGTKSVKVFHEAREAPEAKVGDLWKRTNVAFKPSCMHTLIGPKGERRVLIGRDANDYTAGMQGHPLLVDPDKLTVEVMQNRVSIGRGYDTQTQDGAIYLMGANVDVKKRDLVKIEYPGTTKSLITDIARGSWAVVVNDEVHVVTIQMDWWHGSLKEKQLRHMGTMANGEFDHVGFSSHYGVMILFRANASSASGGRVHQVVVTPKKSAP